jgi:hypothetical protein
MLLLVLPMSIQAHECEMTASDISEMNLHLIHPILLIFDQSTWNDQLIWLLQRSDLLMRYVPICPGIDPSPTDISGKYIKPSPCSSTYSNNLERRIYDLSP